MTKHNCVYLLHMKTKYNNKASGRYASRLEARRAFELKVLERKGIISELREQVRFELLPSQYGECGKDLKGKTVKVLLERPCFYIADFVYRDANGNMVVEDTKGFHTKDYIIKRKLMLYIHGIIIKKIKK